MTDVDEGAAPAGEQPPAQPDGRPGGRDDEARAARDGRADGAEQPEEKLRLDAPKGSPLGGAGEAGGARTAREARTNLHIEGDNQIYDGNTFYQTQVRIGTDDVFVDGPVPDEELERLRRVYCPAPGYDAMTTRLRSTHLLALCGEHGTGRTSTGLALLRDVAAAGVSRVDPATALGSVDKEKFDPDRGYLLELPAEDAGAVPAASPGADKDGGTGRNGTGRPSDLHLDRLSALLAERGAYGVLVVGGGDFADRLVRGRYGALCTPPPADDVLERHVADLLAGSPPQLLQLARSTAGRPDVEQALGLGDLRPGEAARLATHLAAHARGEFSDTRLLTECAAFAPRQAREWFAGADRPGTLPEALPALRAAALRLSLAVFNGSAESLVTEAGELLAWELAVTLDPQYAPGRPLFTEQTQARLAAARAVPDRGVEDLGDAAIPVRVTRFQGRRLASAVLCEAWDGYHNVRGPLTRWLRSLCDDQRPQMWVRAAIVAGVLCARDYLYGFSELLLPLARADSPVQQMAAATALAEASRDPQVRPAVRGLLRDWARGDDRSACETAAFAHGYGLVAGSVTGSLDELARIGCREDGGKPADAASYSVVRLLAGPEPEVVLRRLARWLRDRQQVRQNLALVVVLRALSTRTSHLWGLQGDSPVLESYGSWPLAAALVAAHPDRASWLADLVHETLNTARAGAAAQEEMSRWMRRAGKEPRQLDVLCAFLPRLVEERRDRDRLLLLVARLERDSDEPLAPRAAARMRAVLEGEGRR
ncbi:hypothetical protein A6A06_20765 [Streptomyces sp. CB02923]|uniref:hypothetical protein n=1 Tax=Streptomyces sp. CB02923 TaxID=1718985 RepID=UPI000939AFCA|nr:hypothetical protein [Streptomyces sp. CB02923]OKI01242.1 hypothetical protein A6A06_20765 [Streptomyces sp. CB02923]